MSSDRILMNLRAYLRGIADVNSQHLLILSECKAVRSLAKQDLKRRVAETLGELTDEEVRAIACEDVDLQQLASEAMAGKKSAGTDNVAQLTLSISAYSELENIAKSTLRVSTLKSRNSDALDFYDVSVWAINQALEQAYIAGMTDHHRSAG
ncbi:hypothetical protein DBB29_24925 [Pandoraea cepalis]|uniref:DUF6900 domain-containing protein n=1 Tax=Pandoraea cepalis TaxID=2508294 RepID=A0AAW7MGN4_9BURK|nr:hypothetical protein [Pandoraea cepalis]MDN4571906.1 hypothetical protein [Pandoraea cepalis]MDN4581360.1 hypothetical protein [Pandoraea cepalis]